MITRREFSRAAAAALALPALTGRWAAASPVGGVNLGVQTYSFRDLPRPAGGDAVDVVIKAMADSGLDECELWSPQVEPGSTTGRDASAEDRQRARDELRRWRTSTPMSHFDEIRRKFAAARMTIFAFNLSFNDSFTDDEIDRGFEAARALGAQVITASTTLSVAKRVAPFAERHRMPVAMHNHSRVDDPNEFATPQSFTAALAMSSQFRINLDIGHFTAANFDALAFLQAHHDRITNLHLKDRKKNQGDNVPWGEGDTPIREVLSWLKQRKSPVRAYIEYEYQGTKGVVEEVKACRAYAAKALTS
jgi:sugar phosphate isomerase/epimerase